MDIFLALFLFFTTLAGLSALACARALLLIRLRKVYLMVRFNNRLMPTATAPFDVPYPTRIQLQKIYALTIGIEISYSDYMDIYDVIEGIKAYAARSVIAVWSAVGIGGFARDLSRSVYWADKAANARDVDAQFMLGGFHE